MEVLTLMLMFLTVSGYSYVLQPRLTVTQIAGLDRDLQSEPGDVSMSVEEKEKADEEQRSEGLTPEEEKMMEMFDKTDEEFKESDEMDKLKQEEEERVSRLVAGIHLHKEPREEGNGEKGDDVVVSDLTPPLSSTQLGGELVSPATIQIITPSQDPPGSPPPLHHRSQASSQPPSPHARASLPDPVSTLLPGEAMSVLLLEDLLAEVLQSHFMQNELHMKASPDSEEVMDKNKLFKPAAVQPETEYTSEVAAATPKPKEVITEDLNKPNPTPKSNKNNLTVDLKPNTSQPKTVKLTENDTKLPARRNKASPPQPRLTEPSARPRPTTANKSSNRSPKINRSSKNKTMKKTREKKRKKDNKTQKPPEKKKVITPTHFPYFKDDYCPPECACYGRVVQCSDKGVDKVPYGIPYNARYILLMNNHIDSIQLDLLNEYVSMEFLVLSNNRLTDGTIEGAFQGVPALRRLYLDRNLLVSVPSDLPVSLEELRLDNNRLSVMSAAVWARCPGLLVLSLSNNSLGNGSESLPDGVLSPLGNLRTLNLDHNQLTSVPLGLPLSVKELYLKGNLIEQFRGGAFDGTSELVVLDLSTNRLTNKGLPRESLLNATHLESLNLEGNRLKQVPRHLPQSLKTLNLEGNLISSIKKAAFGTLKNLEHLGLARNKIVKVEPGAFRMLPVLHQLDLCRNALRQVPRQLPEALHSVALKHNKIHSVPRDAFCWGNKSLSGLVRVQLEHNLIDMGKLDAQAFRCLRGFQVVHFY